MSGCNRLYSLRYMLLGIVMAITLATGAAYAADSKVVIVNGTSNHCLPYLSCYKPFEVVVKPGDTITWINNDTRPHTATAGTPNSGPVGLFDSGSILPGKAYQQFFGTAGRFPYYDKTDMWPSGIVVVSNRGPTNAEIGWVNGSLSLSSGGNDPLPRLVMTKKVANSGDVDANSVLFRLRILNGSGFLFYDAVLNGSVPARQNSPVSFTWDNPQPGNYVLNFDAENPARQSNENIDTSSDLISISKSSNNQLQPIVGNDFSIGNRSGTVPEFGQASFLVLFLAISSVLVMSFRSATLGKLI